MALSADVRARIQEQYRAWAWLLDVPEIGGLLERAVTEGWSELRFIGELQGSAWYRQRTETERQMEALEHVDPQTFQRRFQESYASVQDMAGRMGIALEPGEVGYIARWNTMSGQTPESDTFRMFLRQWVAQHPDRIVQRGSIYAGAKQVQNIQRQEFFYQGAWDAAVNVGAELALGFTDEQAFRAQQGEWFAGLYPHLAPRLKSGETLAQIAQGARDLVAKELELGGVEDVDMLTTNQWKWLLGMPDPTSGQVRLPTQQEVLAAARKDPRWKRTIGGTALATDLVDGITKTFGVRA